MKRVRAVLVVALAGLAGPPALVGCVTVQPWQRENLSKRAMTPGKDGPEQHFDQHARGAREGSEGGYGEAGGGCGCN